LLVSQVLGEIGENTSRERDVASFYVNAGGIGEGLDDRQQRIGCQGRRFIGFV
jgi:hypothetical protein